MTADKTQGLSELVSSLIDVDNILCLTEVMFVVFHRPLYKLSGEGFRGLRGQVSPA